MLSPVAVEATSPFESRLPLNKMLHSQKWRRRRLKSTKRSCCCSGFVQHTATPRQQQRRHHSVESKPRGAGRTAWNGLRFTQSFSIVRIQ